MRDYREINGSRFKTLGKETMNQGRMSEAQYHPSVQPGQIRWWVMCYG